MFSSVCSDSGTIILYDTGTDIPRFFFPLGTLYWITLEW